MPVDHDAVIVGGGIIGCSVALFLRRLGASVLLLEREPAVLRRASFANQARVHNGYHYPRSFLTALRSRVNYPRFTRDYADCIDDGFAKYYAIARQFSKVSASQFLTFCQRIGAPAERAPAEVRALFDPTSIEDVFVVQECVFDAERLGRRLDSELAAAGVEVRFDATAWRVEASGTELAVEFEEGGACRRVTATQVYNCTYSAINELLARSGLPLLPLKHELTEMALTSVPEPLRHMGVTVMCGPFFSLMPFPARGLHTLSHVRYTPHTWWREDESPAAAAPVRWTARSTTSKFPHMLRDARRYMPALRECRYEDSLWETKTVLLSSEVDDSRPILFRRHHGLRNLTCIMGGKIDNVYDVLEELRLLQRAGELA